MTIEEKINDLINNDGIEDGWIQTDINKWKWYKEHSMPYSILLLLSEENCNDKGILETTFYKIDTMIKEADATECLTSKSEYIRECKKWYIQSKIKI